MANKVDFKELVNKRITKDTKFMGSLVTMQKLSVAEVLSIQAQAREAEKDESKNFEILKMVIKMAVEGANELSDEDFDKCPLDELSKLAADIMQFSGIGNDSGK